MAHVRWVEAAESGITRPPQQPSLAAGETVEDAPDLERLAQLVADGSIPFPPDWDADVAGRLAFEVLRIRRTRLIRFIARVMATSIRREAAETKGIRREHEE